MDGYVGMAFGYQRVDLSVRVQRFGLRRQDRAAATVRALAVYLRDQGDTVAHLRALVSPTVPELAEARRGLLVALVAAVQLPVAIIGFFPIENSVVHLVLLPCAFAVTVGALWAVRRSRVQTGAAVVAGIR